MTQWLKQNTATDRKIGPFIDDTDGKTAETGLTTAYTLIYLSKNGGALTAKHETTAIAHDALGYYLCKLDATDTNTLGALKVATHVAGHLPVWHEFMVVPANVWDSFFGASLLVVDAAAVKTDSAAILADTGELQTEWANGGRLDLILDGASAPAATTVADAVWDEALSGHAAGGSAGAALTGAGSAGDPWTTTLPGAYGAGTAGAVIGGIPAVKADTAAILAGMGGTTPEAALTLALKLLRNKVVTDPATGVMTVYDDNGTDVLYTANVYEDVAGTMPFDGSGANRRDRLA